MSYQISLGLIACTSSFIKRLVGVKLKQLRQFAAKIKMRRLEYAFDKYGRFLARHPLPFLVSLFKVDF